MAEKETTPRREVLAALLIALGVVLAVVVDQRVESQVHQAVTIEPPPALILSTGP